MNPFFMAFLRAVSVALDDASKKSAEDYILQNQQYKKSENDYYKPVPENNKEVSNITRQRAEEIGFQVFRTKDDNDSPCYMITKFKGREFILRFPEYIDNLPVRIIGSEIFSYSNAEWVEEVYIPETVTLIKSRAFSHCTNLKEVYFSGITPKMYDDSFCDCPKLKNHLEKFIHNFNVPDFTKLNQLDFTKRRDRDGNLCYEILRYKGYDTVVRFPEYIDGLPVRIIGMEVFERKNYDTDKWEVHWVEQVWIPKTVILIKDCAFMDCADLERIHFEGDIPEIQPDALIRCNKLRYPPALQERITDPWRKPESYNTQIPTRFETERISGRNAVRITKIFSYRNEMIIPEKIDGLPVVEVIGGVPTDRDERRRNAGNYTLKKIYFPDSVEKIGKMAFMKCWGLESVRLPDNPNLEMSKDSFWGCEKLRLENVTFPDGKDYSDYMDAFGNCIGMQSDYHRKMCIEHEQVKLSKQIMPEEHILVNNTDKYIVISEKKNNIYDLLHYYKNVIIDGYENISTTQKWLLNYVGIGNIIFRDGENMAVIPVIENYKRYGLADSLITDRHNFYITCIENKSADGKFFDMEYYDENILNLLTSIKRKLDVCYYRLISGYRLSQKHAWIYEKFVRKHAKKSVYRAIDAHDRKRLEWCKKMNLLNSRNYNAVLEYAKRKGNAYILD